MKCRLFLSLAAFAYLAGCAPGGVGGAFSAAQQANIFSTFKQVSTAQFLRLTDRDEFARSLAQLQREGYGTEQMEQAIAAQQTGKSLYGHIFKDITGGENGGSVDSKSRYGLSAVPEKSGSGTSFLMLIDATKMKFDEERGASAGGVEYYKTDSPQSPIDTWPGSATLAKWERIRMRSPQEGLNEARSLKKKYDEGVQ